ncbi:hypothetical protein N9N67_02375 [Bacteriovoracaceae bacterium]|nr:hypothetical protein [Bacteriovoracaceae bacterium]
MTNQLRNDMDAISFKVQRSRGTALGAMIGLKSNEDNTLYGIGFKFYKLIYDEPQLSFYGVGTLAMFNYVKDDTTENGYQLDGGMGSEFHFAGLESIGFSFEFGLSINKVNEQNNFETFGDHIIQAAVHFYL